ncbi:unnamed protein product [Arabidopsis arenosa]|uniref:PA domain-containing protein n=1 Tax=Arabidopsis arenosa TaxID=38785 RepID=A0A8S2AZW7_ARAAE|nr:unnamed protein product [Arabidopsis arenosa]
MDNFAPLVYAPDVVVPGVSRNDALLCLPNSLSPDLVKGKVVLCLRGYGSGSTIGKGLEVKRAGGVGMILANSRDNDAFDVESHFVPTALVFSSTPDIIAPGLNILAAWSGADSASKDSIDQRVLASMTNEDNEPIQDYDGSPANPFALGSGHFRPTKAASPGLVYDASYQSYLLYCCSVGLTNLDPTFKCPSRIPPGYNLNYPSISIPYLAGTVTVTRTVTRVGRPGNSSSVYVFNAQPPYGVIVKAEPNVLVFDRIGQKKRFNISFTTQRYEFTGEARRDRYRFGWFSFF